MNAFSKIVTAVMATGFASAMATPVLAVPVVNGGFEQLNGSSGFVGWTISGGGVTPDSVDPNTGNFDAVFTDIVGDPVSTLTQTIATSPGNAYRLSFTVLDESGLSDDLFSLQFGQFKSTITGNRAAPPGTLPSFYTSFAFDLPVGAVSSPMTILTFSAFVDAANGTAWNLDDVALNPIPEPWSVVVFSIAVLGLALMRRGVTLVHESDRDLGEVHNSQGSMTACDGHGWRGSNSSPAEIPFDTKP